MHSDSTWATVVAALALPSGSSILDIAPRGDDSVARALAARDPAAAITSLDTSAAAAASLLTLIESRLSPQAFDLISFHHTIDDIAAAAIAERERISPGGNPTDAESDLLRALRAYWRSGDFDRVVAPRFTETAAACLHALRPSGRMLFAHQVLDSDLLHGHPLEIYADYIPLARRWLAGAALPIREIALDGLDPQWWLCLQRA